MFETERCCLFKKNTSECIVQNNHETLPCVSPAFPSACDSQGASSVPSVSTPIPPSLPCSHTDAALLEEQYVHHVYDSIASHFSSTRHSPWPRVCQFLDSLPPGSILADVGCGNGKYLGVNPDVITVSVIMFCCFSNPWIDITFLFHFCCCFFGNQSVKCYTSSWVIHVLKNVQIAKAASHSTLLQVLLVDQQQLLQSTSKSKLL